jgi:hypothetical protein
MVLPEQAQAQALVALEPHLLQRHQRCYPVAPMISLPAGGASAGAADGAAEAGTGAGAGSSGAAPTTTTSVSVEEFAATLKGYLADASGTGKKFFAHYFVSPELLTALERQPELAHAKLDEQHNTALHLVSAYCTARDISYASCQYPSLLCQAIITALESNGVKNITNREGISTCELIHGFVEAKKRHDADPLHRDRNKQNRQPLNPKACL